MISLPDMISPALPDIGAAFGRPSVFLGFSYPLRLAATRTALIRLSHQPASGRAPTSNYRRHARAVVIHAVDFLWHKPDGDLPVDPRPRIGRPLRHHQGSTTVVTEPVIAVLE